MIAFIWLVPVLPLAGAVSNALIGRLLGKRVVSLIGIGSVLAAFVIAALAFFELQNLPQAARAFDVPLYTWITAGRFSVNLSFLYDPLSAIMLLVVTGVGFLIHVYSMGYMDHDPGYARFFVYMNLFVFSMLLLVLGDNYLVLYAGWELVGLCSYLLIGFWFTRSSARSAAVKAFVTTRIGDLFFSLGVILIWSTFGTLAYSEVFHLAETHLPGGAPVITVITLLLFAGAVGKSAQIPLYVWLPDAMEGPTPVSALIHAATMVTAGVYMVARSHALYELAPLSLSVVGTIGAVTALFAATIALVQTDLKRILAYSTISQLGYMFLGAGVAAFGASIFHLMTHAFFKALLFLAAGSVMHAMNDVIDVRRLGGLARPLRITWITFVLGALALAGFPFTSGFFSKDEILAAAFASGNYVLYGLGIVTAGLTAFYIFRAVFLTFHGEPRWLEDRGVKRLPDGRLFVETPHGHGGEQNHAARAGEEHGHAAHGAPRESALTMTAPLMTLAILAVFGGFVGMPAVLGPNWFAEFMAAVFGAEHGGLEGMAEWLILGASSLVALAGILVAYWFYVVDPSLPQTLAADYAGLYKLLVNKYYVDQIYDTLFVRPGRQVATWLWQGLDAGVIDGSLNGLARWIGLGGRYLRRAQAGYARAYALAMLVGIVAVIAAFVLR